jgi:hypothetical protein
MKQTYIYKTKEKKIAYYKNMNFRYFLACAKNINGNTGHVSGQQYYHGIHKDITNQTSCHSFRHRIWYNRE